MMVQVYSEGRTVCEDQHVAVLRARPFPAVGFATNDGHCRHAVHVDNGRRSSRNQ